MQIEKYSEIVEDHLGCKLPNDYSNFLNSVGYGVVNDLEIFGYSDETVDINQLPCVVGATKLYRKNILADCEIAIASDDKYVYGFNCEKNEYFKKDYDNKYEKIDSIFI